MLVVADRYEALAANGERGRVGVAIVQGRDLRIPQNQIRRFGHSRAQPFIERAELPDPSVRRALGNAPKTC